MNLQRLKASEKHEQIKPELVIRAVLCSSRALWPLATYFVIWQQGNIIFAPKLLLEHSLGYVEHFPVN